ncbi:MAG: 16S rRNA (guanine(527)-N(7))-methyltransferase RsmG [bacterium]
MNKKEFIESIEVLNIEVTEEKMELLDKYFKILKEYNEHTNLTRIIEEEDVYLKHFYDSLTIAQIVNLKEINNLLDIGSGAGFPGVVLKIFFPEIELSLLDSNNKKTKFLGLLCEELKIEAKIYNERAEQHTKKYINSYDLVVARAVANMRVLTELSLPLVKEEGLFLAMKSDNEEEIKESHETIECLKSKIIKEETFSLPYGVGERKLILIQKEEKSRYSKLRDYDKILKNGLKKN